MKKIFQKILIATFVLSFLFAPVAPDLSKFTVNQNIVSAQQTLTNIQGTGNWTVATSGPTSSGSLSGTTVGYPDGSYSGKFWIISIGANADWTGTVTNNVLQGSWTVEGNVTSGGSWNGNATYGTQTAIDNFDTGGLASNGVVSTGTSSTPTYYGCDALNALSWFTNCLVQAIYIVIFQPVAFFARLAAYILDFFVFYAISSGSYTSDFIGKGWGVVRDIANILFIIALLYVAVKTVLDLNSSNNKKMVGMIIVMALLINFSLFATKVVIDASNILARVFYANIESVNPNGELIEGTDTGAKSITVGLVRQFNPHQIFGSNAGASIKNNLGTFTAILILSLLMMAYMIFMFISVALLFVSRVIMLWILMIFSPIAFVSLTIPGVNIPGFGWKEWWSRLSDNAFLAPIFVFFLYLIITFGDLVKVVTGNNYDPNATVSGATITGQVEESTFVTYMGIIIPFILIFVLLMKAKEIAVKMSGEMGAAITKVGAMAGGFAGGAALGATALVATRAVGAAGAAGGALGRSKLAQTKFGQKIGLNNLDNLPEKLRTASEKKGVTGWLARKSLKTIDSTQGASFDLRKTGLGQFVGSKTGLDFQSSKAIGLGSKEGGLKGYQERKAKEIEKEKELYKTSMTDNETKEYTLKRREEYLKDRDIAVKNAKDEAQAAGKSATDIDKAGNKALEVFVSMKGDTPKIHEKADGLNKERMETFKDNIGKTDLLSSVAYSSSKALGGEINASNYTKDGNIKRYKEELKKKKKKEAREEAIRNDEVFDEAKFESTYVEDTTKYDAVVGRNITDQRAQTAKLVIGSAAAVGVGAGALGLGAGLGTVLGGGAVAGVTAVGQNAADKQVKDKVIESMDKEAKNTEKLANRIADLNKTLKDGKEIQRTNIVDSAGNIVLDPTTGNPMTSGLFIQNTPGVDTDQVDKDKLRIALASMDTEIKLLEKKTTLTAAEKTDLNKKKVEREIMQSLRNTEKELFDLTGKKPNQGGSSAPSTPPPASTP